MGTRHLIAAILDGEHKIAQYGQWDGYFEGQGKDVVEFILNNDMDKFKEILKKVDCIAEYGFDRDDSADILTMVLDGGLRKTNDSWNFGYDSLFCEYAYVLDMDAMVLEIYSGYDGKLKGRFDGKPNGIYLTKIIPFDKLTITTMSDLSKELED